MIYSDFHSVNFFETSVGVNPLVSTKYLVLIMKKMNRTPPKKKNTG